MLICSTVVEPSTQNPKIEGSNPATGTEREKMMKKDAFIAI
jgi:hypothetical protein